MKFLKGLIKMILLAVLFPLIAVESSLRLIYLAGGGENERLSWIMEKFIIDW